MKELLRNFWNNERLFKNYITSLLGVILVAYMIYLISKNQLDTQDAIAYGGWAFTLFRAKDTIIGIKEKKDE